VPSIGCSIGRSEHEQKKKSRLLAEYLLFSLTRRRKE